MSESSADIEQPLRSSQRGLTLRVGDGESSEQTATGKLEINFKIKLLSI